MIIAINNTTTYQDISEFENIFPLISSKENVRKAVNYSFPIPNPNDNPLTFPLILYCDCNITFCLLNFTAGYGGEGPNGTCEILEKCGFDFDRDLILKNSGGKPVYVELTK